MQKDRFSYSVGCSQTEFVLGGQQAHEEFWTRALSDRVELRSFQPWIPGWLSLYSNGYKNFSLLKVKNWPAFLVLSENIYSRDSYFIPTPTVNKKMKHCKGTYITIPGKN